MATLSAHRPTTGDDPFLVIRRLPSLVLQFLATAVRLGIIGVELLLALIAVPLIVPFLLLRVLDWGCSLLDTALAPRPPQRLPPREEAHPAERAGDYPHPQPTIGSGRLHGASPRGL
jgi:hypothetical protein